MNYTLAANLGRVSKHRGESYIGTNNKPSNRAEASTGIPICPRMDNDKPGLEIAERYDIVSQADSDTNKGPTAVS